MTPGTHTGHQHSHQVTHTMTPSAPGHMTSGQKPPWSQQCPLSTATGGWHWSPACHNTGKDPAWHQGFAQVCTWTDIHAHACTQAHTHAHACKCASTPLYPPPTCTRPGLPAVTVTAAELRATPRTRTDPTNLLGAPMAPPRLSGPIVVRSPPPHGDPPAAALSASASPSQGPATSPGTAAGPWHSAAAHPGVSSGGTAPPGTPAPPGAGTAPGNPACPSGGPGTARGTRAQCPALALPPGHGTTPWGPGTAPGDTSMSLGDLCLASLGPCTTPRDPVMPQGPWHSAGDRDTSPKHTRSLPGHPNAALGPLTLLWTPGQNQFTHSCGWDLPSLGVTAVAGAKATSPARPPSHSPAQSPPPRAVPGSRRWPVRCNGG